jgi:hypothetical protein
MRNIGPNMDVLPQAASADEERSAHGKSQRADVPTGGGDIIALGLPGVTSRSQRRSASTRVPRQSGLCGHRREVPYHNPRAITEVNMRLDLMAVAAALCLAAAPAVAQQAISSVPGPGANLLRSCNALTAQSNCALGLRPNQGSNSSGSLMGQSNNLMNPSSSGLGSTLLPRASGTLGATGPADNLSRGISNGFVGGGRTSDPLGIDSEDAFRNMSSSSFAHSSLGGFGRSGAAGPLGGESNRLR